MARRQARRRLRVLRQIPELTARDTGDDICEIARSNPTRLKGQHYPYPVNPVFQFAIRFLT